MKEIWYRRTLIKWLLQRNAGVVSHFPRHLASPPKALVSNLSFRSSHFKFALGQFCYEPYEIKQHGICIFTFLLYDNVIINISRFWFYWCYNIFTRSKQSLRVNFMTFLFQDQSFWVAYRYFSIVKNWRLFSMSKYYYWFLWVKLLCLLHCVCLYIYIFT